MEKTKPLCIEKLNACPHADTLSKTRLKAIKTAHRNAETRGDRVRYDTKPLDEQFVRAPSTRSEIEIDTNAGIDTGDWMWIEIPHSVENAHSSTPKTQKRARDDTSIEYGFDTGGGGNDFDPDSPGAAAAAAETQASSSSASSSSSSSASAQQDKDNQRRNLDFHNHWMHRIKDLTAAFAFRYTSWGKVCALCHLKGALFCFSCKSSFCDRCSRQLHSRVLGSGPVHLILAFGDASEGEWSGWHSLFMYLHVLTHVICIASEEEKVGGVEQEMDDVADEKAIGDSFPPRFTADDPRSQVRWQSVRFAVGFLGPNLVHLPVHLSLNIDRWSVRPRRPPHLPPHPSKILNLSPVPSASLRVPRSPLCVTVVAQQPRFQPKR